MSYLDKINDIYDHIGNGTAMEAFEEYYADDIVMVLEDGTEVEGKDTNRERENEFFGSVEEFHGLEVQGVTSNEDTGVTSVESTMTVTFKGTDDPVDIEQVAVQHWDGDEISRERFYGTQN
ncbi:nuclear transport factor 2 family protein [Aliifodinibius sp. S!AR15-10]|uniref:nuclear transport factor 2 family protein n=1 Tax=Aliifodinibius sp. S!AR15-10 TaxID=2950437 RepID=UPI002863879C|nr:nuclear transport factor 2 family protein [Aliifodinibius sp. S!AR15-10]MDR8394320.1 nuclear transport factor 2 family protein [Aliifodinibius sp. S!AR15-10]